VTFGAGSAGAETPAESLWRAGSTEGEAACGFGAHAEPDNGGSVITIRPDHPQLDLVPPELLLDAIVFGSNATLFEY
jgi:hypothetical protein